jgi:hypothetical protein
MEAINEFLNSPLFAGIAFIAIFFGGIFAAMVLMGGGDNE